VECRQFFKFNQQTGQVGKVFTFYAASYVLRNILSVVHVHRMRPEINVMVGVKIVSAKRFVDKQERQC